MAETVDARSAAELSLLGAAILQDAKARAAPVLDAIRAIPAWSNADSIALARAVLAVADRNGGIADPVLVAGELAAAGRVNGAAHALVAEALQVPNAAAWPEYAAEIGRASARGRVLELLPRLRQKLAHPEQTADDADVLERDLAEALARMKPQPATRLCPSRTAADIMAQDLPAIDYGIAPLCSLGNLTMIQGEPKSGKSCFALYLALSSAFGAWCAGRFVCTQPRPVLFFTWEDGLRRIKTRLHQYVAGLGATAAPPDLHVYTHDDAPLLRLDSADGRSLLARVIAEHKSEVVILDTLSHLHACDENAKQDMQPVMDALKNAARDLHVAVVVLHHSGKPSKDAQRSIAYRSRGSSAIAAAADIIIDWGDRGSTNITPCKFLSKDDDSQEFSVVYEPQDDESIRWKIEDAEPSDAKGVNAEKVLVALNELMKGFPEGVGQGTLVKACGLARNTVKVHLLELMGKGKVRWKLRGQSKVWIGVNDAN